MTLRLTMLIELVARHSRLNLSYLRRRLESPFFVDSGDSVHRIPAYVQLAPTPCVGVGAFLFGPVDQSCLHWTTRHRQTGSAVTLTMEWTT